VRYYFILPASSVSVCVSSVAPHHSSEQLLNHFSLVRHEHRPVLWRVERVAPVDAEFGVDGGGDVVGEVGAVEDVAPFLVGAADDLAAGDTRAGEGVGVAVRPVVPPLELVEPRRAAELGGE